MTEPLYTPDRRYMREIARDVLAVVLILVCVAGLTWVGFETDWRLGAAALFTVAGAVGVALGMSRQ